MFTVISETAKLNNLRLYYYFRHILMELSKYCDEKGNIDPAKLDQLMPWADEFPEECRKPRRSIKAALNLRVGAGFDVYGWMESDEYALMLYNKKKEHMFPKRD